MNLYDEKCQWKWNVDSEEFSAPDNEEFKFNLIIIPKNKGKKGDEYLGVGWNTQKIPAILGGTVTMGEKCCIIDEKGKILWGRSKARKSKGGDLINAN